MTPDPEAFLAPLRRLTAREREVLHLDCQGHTAEEIADALRIGERTVYGHLQRIYAKLGLVEERDNLRQRKLVFFCLALPQLATDEEGAAASSPPEPPESAEPPEDEPAAPAAIERDRAAIVRWRQGELQGPDGPVPPAGDPAGGADTPGPLAHRAVVEPERAGLPLARGRPSWGLLLLIAVLAALLGGAVTAMALSQTNRPTPAAATATTATATGAAPQPTPTALFSAAPVSSATVTIVPTPPGISTPTPVAPTPTSTGLVTINPAATPLDLAGTVASGLPGTPLRPGQPVTSVLDAATKPDDLYALNLRAGTQLTVSLQASAYAFSATFGPDGALPKIERGNLGLCNSDPNCVTTIPIPSDGRYLLLVNAYGHGVRYTLRTSVAPLAVPPGATDLTGHVASATPGTPLTLGTTVASVVDERAKPSDVYALSLRADQTLQVAVDATGDQDIVTLVPPGGAGGQTLCSALQTCRPAVPIAASGTYSLVIGAVGPAVRYTLHVSIH